MESTSPSEKSRRIINYRPLFEIAIGLMLGIAVAGLLPQNGGIVLCTAVLLCATVHAVMKRKMRLMIFALCILLGNVLSIVNVPYKIDGGIHTVTGFAENVTVNGGKCCIVMKTVKIDGKKFNKRVIINTKAYSTVDVGDEINFKIYIDEIERNNKKYSYYMSRGIGAVSEADKAVVLSRGNLPLTRFRHSAASTVGEMAVKLFGEKDGILIASALVGGFEIDEQRYAIYQATGTAHILAISGIHMTLVAMMVGLLIPNRLRIVKPIAVIAAILFYLAVSEPTAGVQRAAIMSGIAVIFRSMRRSQDSLSALSLAAIVLLVINPYAMFSVSFMLSFSAAFGIIVFSPFLTAELEDRGSKLASIGIVTTISASVSVAAIQMHFFGTFPMYLLLANLIAVPAFSLLLQMSIFCILLGFVLPSAAIALANIPSGLLVLTENFMEMISRLPYAEIEVVPLPSICCVIALLMMYFVSDNVFLPKRKKLLSVFSGFIAFISIYGIAILKEWKR